MPSRYLHAMAFDAIRSKVMVFGGEMMTPTDASYTSMATVLGDFGER